MDLSLLTYLIVLIDRAILSNGCKDMDFKNTMDGQALANHTIQTTSATNDLHCQSKCFMDDYCVSYNFEINESGEPFTCELNDADHKQFPDDLVPRPGTIYRMAENTCNCNTNGVCRMDFIQNTHQCFEVKNCQSSKVFRGDYFLDGSDGHQTGLCRGVFKSPDNSPAQPYRITVEIYSYKTAATSNIRMHPGIVFNAIDENNFDLFYFRPHETQCHSVGLIQPGKLQADTLQLKTLLYCKTYQLPANAWFKVGIDVHPGYAKIFIDDNYAASYNGTANTLIKKGGLMVFNGYKNAVKFQNYRIENL